MFSSRAAALRAVAVLLVVVAALSLPQLAEAGCLLQYRECTECAQALLWDAMKSFSPSEVTYANLYLADCAIDFYHCMLLGKAHQYTCPVAL